MSAKFLIADDYRSHPSYSVPFSKSDDEANEKRRGSDHEHLFDSPNIGVETGSIKDNIEKNETNITALTKRLGEDDYTEVESYKLQAFSANRNRDISLNDSFKSHFKRQYHLLSSLSRIWLGQGIRSWPLSIIKESVGTGVLSPRSRPF